MIVGGTRSQFGPQTESFKRTPPSIGFGTGPKFKSGAAHPHPQCRFPPRPVHFHSSQNGIFPRICPSLAPRGCLAVPVQLAHRKPPHLQLALAHAMLSYIADKQFISNKHSEALPPTWSPGPGTYKARSSIGNQASPQARSGCAPALD